MMETSKRLSIVPCAFAWLVFSFVFITPVQASTPGHVVINEVAWSGTAASPDDQYIELFNTTGAPIDLSGWRLGATDGTPVITISGGIIAAYGYFLLERDDETTTSLPGHAFFTGAIDGITPGEIFELRDNSNTLIDRIVFGAGWTAGTGAPDYFTAERINPTMPGVASNFVSNNGVIINGLDANSNPLNGTPGAQNAGTSAAVTATNADKVIPDDDAGGDALPGETVEYTINIMNTGTGAATGVQYTDPDDPNTTFTAGSVKATPLAIDDHYSTIVNTPIAVNIANGVLHNDFDIPKAVGTGLTVNPTIVNGVTTLGGTVSLAEDGSFTYSPPNDIVDVTDDFTYMALDTDGNLNSGQVFITLLGIAPEAFDDDAFGAPIAVIPPGFTVPLVDGPGDVVERNDDAGFPVAVVTHFGGFIVNGVSQGGAVTDNVAGTTAAPLPGFPDGALTGNADGSGSFTSPAGFTGLIQFRYRIGNTAGFDDALVTLNIEPLRAPTAENDPNGGLPSNSIPTDVYHTAINTQLIVPEGVNDLLANDDRGSPSALIVEYGITGDPDAQKTIGNPTPTDEGGTVTIQDNGSFVYVPPSNIFTGTDQFAYRISNPLGLSEAVVTVGVGIRPEAVMDNYMTTVNINLDINEAGGVILGLGMDIGNELEVKEVQGLDTNVGTQTATDQIGTGGVTGFITLAVDGSFTYTPPPDFTGDDTFSYVVGNGFGNSVAVTVTITISPGDPT